MHDLRRYWPLAFQSLFVLALAAISSRPIPFEFSRPMKATIAFWAAGLALMLVRSGWVALRAQEPLSTFRSNLATDRPILARAFKLAIVIGLAIALHGWAKTMIPHVTSYWTDPYLAGADRLFFGIDPWPLFRSRFLNDFYVMAYLSWFAIVFGTLGLLAFSRRDQSRLIFSFLIIFIFVGTVGQYVLPSAGPMFYERLGFGDRFSQLVATNDPMFNGVSDYLWNHYLTGGAGLGTGISAMPSMHVTLAVWVVFAAYEFWKPLAVPAGLYALLLWAASIASGWHYALDGIVGVAAAIFVHAMITRKPRREPGFAQGVAAPLPTY